MFADERRSGIDRFMGRRPLALGAMLYAAGALVGYYGSAPIWCWAVLAGAALAVLLASRRRVWLFALAVAVGALVTAQAARVPAADAAEGVRIEGRVATEPAWNGQRSAFVLADVTIAGLPHGRDLRIYLYGAPVSARIGDRLSAVGSTWLPQGRRNPHGFDFRAWLWTRGGVLCAMVDAADAAFWTPEGASHWTMLGAARARLGSRIDALFPEGAPLARALLLGDRTALDEGMQDDFRAAGLAHLLAVSGLHVSGLALVLEWLLRQLRCPRKAAIWATLAVLAAYSALIGFPASVVRSAVMFLAARGALLAGRPGDALTGLGAALLALLGAQPLYIADAGFQLSFGAVLGLMLLTEPVAGLLRAPRPFSWPGLRDRGAALKWLWAQAMALLAASIAAQLAALPILAQTFGAVTPLAPLANLAAIPLSTLALPLVALKLALGTDWFLLPDWTLNWLGALASAAARMPAGSATLPAWPHWLVGVYLAACFAASPYVRTPARRRWAVAAALPLLALLSVPLARWALPDGLNIAFLDAGQADAIVVRAEGVPYAVDLGKDGGPAVDYLVRTGQRPRAVFLTHPHADHCGGLGALLKVMRPDVIYIPECWERVEAEGDVQEQLRLAESMGVAVIKLAAGDRVRLSERAVAEVIHPERGYAPREDNGASMVLLVRYGDGAALLTGDLPASEEIGAMPDVDVLKAAHHGSGGSNSESMLRMAGPSALVVTVGRNGYGHPAARVLDAAARLGIPVYRTDESGAVFADIREDGGARISTYLEDAA